MATPSPWPASSESREISPNSSPSFSRARAPGRPCAPRPRRRAPRRARPSLALADDDLVALHLAGAELLHQRAPILAAEGLEERRGAHHVGEQALAAELLERLGHLRMLPDSSASTGAEISSSCVSSTRSPRRPCAARRTTAPSRRRTRRSSRVASSLRCPVLPEHAHAALADDVEGVAVAALLEDALAVVRSGAAGSARTAR